MDELKEIAANELRAQLGPDNITHEIFSQFTSQ